MQLVARLLPDNYASDLYALIKLVNAFGVDLNSPQYHKVNQDPLALLWVDLSSKAIASSDPIVKCLKDADLDHDFLTNLGVFLTSSSKLLVFLEIFTSRYSTIKGLAGPDTLKKLSDLGDRLEGFSDVIELFKSLEMGLFDDFISHQSLDVVESSRVHLDLAMRLQEDLISADGNIEMAHILLQEFLLSSKEILSDLPSAMIPANRLIDNSDSSLESKIEAVDESLSLEEFAESMEEWKEIQNLESDESLSSLDWNSDDSELILPDDFDEDADSFDIKASDLEGEVSSNSNIKESETVPEKEHGRDLIPYDSSDKKDESEIKADDRSIKRPTHPVRRKRTSALTKKKSDAANRVGSHTKSHSPKSGLEMITKGIFGAGRSRKLEDE